MSRVRILDPTWEAVEITAANLEEVRSKLTPINRAGSQINVVGDPISVGDWAVEEMDNDGGLVYMVYPAELVEVVTP
jgi:hypothetical protein